MGILIFLIVPIAIFGFLQFFAWAKLRYFMYVRVSQNSEFIRKYPLDYKNFTLRSSDGVNISAWYSPSKKPKGVIILLHGYLRDNGGKSLLLPHAKFFRSLGYSCLMIDKRCVGDSGGKRVTFGVDEWMDAEAAYDFASSLPENRGLKIGFYGVSLGAVESIIAAGHTGKSDFIIASVPFFSFSSLIRFRLKAENMLIPLFYPLVILSALMELGFSFFRFSAEAMIRKVRVPIFIISAKRDSFIDSNDAVLLYRLAKSKKMFWEADSDHLVELERADEFKEKINHFLNTYCL